MTRLEIDDRWDKPCIGYHVQGRPDRLSIEKLQILQRAAMQTAPVALNLIPADALHLSVATLVSAQMSMKSAETQWARIEQATHRELTALPVPDDLSIVFPSLRFTKHAIIVFTKNQSAYLTEMRARFGKLLKSTGIDGPGYDQAHITIARYAEGMTVAEATLRSMEQTDLDLTVHFEPFRLVRESRYPSLIIENI